MDEVEFGLRDVFNGEVERPFETTVHHRGVLSTAGSEEVIGAL
jgi:hypothetical protein